MTTSTSLTIRLASTDDVVAVGILAQLDSARVPAAPLLVAETDGEVTAALSLLDGAAVADPFRPTAHLVDLLRAHAARVEIEAAVAEDGHGGLTSPASGLAPQLAAGC